MFKSHAVSDKFLLTPPLNAIAHRCARECLRWTPQNQTSTGDFGVRGFLFAFRSSPGPSLTRYPIAANLSQPERDRRSARAARAAGELCGRASCGHWRKGRSWRFGIHSSPPFQVHWPDPIPGETCSCQIADGPCLVSGGAACAESRPFERSWGDVR